MWTLPWDHSDHSGVCEYVKSVLGGALDTSRDKTIPLTVVEGTSCTLVPSTDSRVGFWHVLTGSGAGLILCLLAAHWLYSI